MLSIMLTLNPKRLYLCVSNLKMMKAVKFRVSFQEFNPSKRNGNAMHHGAHIVFALRILLFIHEIELC